MLSDSREEARGGAPLGPEQKEERGRGKLTEHRRGPGSERGKGTTGPGVVARDGRGRRGGGSIRATAAAARGGELCWAGA